MSKSTKIVLFIFAIAAVLYGGKKPPVVIEKGIKIKSAEVTETSATIEWETTDERIKIGEDEFILLKSDRQIPSRTGWSDWQEIGRTTNTNFTYDGGFMKSSDIKFKIQVDKGAIIND